MHADFDDLNTMVVYCSKYKKDIKKQEMWYDTYAPRP